LGSTMPARSRVSIGLLAPLVVVLGACGPGESATTEFGRPTCDSSFVMDGTALVTFDGLSNPTDEYVSIKLVAAIRQRSDVVDTLDEVFQMEPGQDGAGGGFSDEASIKYDDQKYPVTCTLKVYKQ